MKVICAWCAKQQPDKEPLDDSRTSHSICGPCAIQWRFNEAAALTPLTLPAPVVLDDGPITDDYHEGAE